MRFLVLILLSGCSLDQWGDRSIASPEGGTYDTGYDDSSVVDEENQESQSGLLSAAEWNDLEHWDFWRDLLEDENADWGNLEASWGLDTAHRVPVQVISEDQPVEDAAIELLDDQGRRLWASRTDSAGEADLFAPPGSQGPFALKIEGELLWEGDVAERVSQRISIQASPSPTPDPVIDLMFVVDTTGSMADELEYLKVELEDVISRVKSQTGLDIRISVNFYRDVGDEYVVRSFPFTTDVQIASQQLSRQQAGGGGDYPEALDAALENAVFEHEWSDSARARLLFPLLDAPPHQSRSTLASLQQTIEAAALSGIRVLPIAGSGIDKSTEFLLRAMDVLTGGTYIFLTDDSGIGGAHLEPTVGQYEVEPLNDLLIRVIEEAVR
ncbi:MAG: VWA domain-containing protein [Myxococcota bacterium]|nr:VWA domain-containing protein [Myxococcota bacterium]